MKHKIIGVDPGSPAACAGVCAGMYLTCINDLPVVDIIDYECLTAEESIELTLCADGAQCGKQQKEFKISLTKEEYEPLGLNFETSLMSPVVCKPLHFLLYRSDASRQQKNAVFQGR